MIQLLLLLLFLVELIEMEQTGDDIFGAVVQTTFKF